jgi:fructokinase
LLIQVSSQSLLEERYVFTVAGEALVDLVGTSPHFTAHAGGSPYNVAVTLARLGEHVSLFARSGRDVFGAMLEEKARESGVLFDRWQIVDEPTSLAVASLDEHGKAGYNFYFDSTAALGWDDSVLELTPTEGVFHLGSIATWRAPSGPVLQELQRHAYESGTTLISYDPNIRPALIAEPDVARVSVERCVGTAHLVKASDEDVAFLYPDRPMADVAARWCDLGARAVVVTLGRDGAVAYGADGELTRQPGLAITVADTVGAGDSFAGGLLAAIGDAVPDSLPERIGDALEQAVVVSAMTCERHGANPPTRAELDERLATQR